MKIDWYSKHTHSLTHILPPPPPPPPTPKIWGKGGGKGDSTGIHSIKLEIATLIENKKLEKKKKKKKEKKKKSCYRSTYSCHQKSFIINFKKCAKFTNNRFFLLQKRLKSINICIFTIKW